MGRHPVATKSPVGNNAWHLAATRSRPRRGQSQAHPGVAALHPVSHRNTSFQPLPRPLGLPPYRYDLAENFPAIGDAIDRAGKMVFHVAGDTGGVQDGEFQNNVAEQMIESLNGKGPAPQFCYHLGDVVYYTGMHDDYYASSMSRTLIMRHRFSPFQVITTARLTIPRHRRRSTVGSTILCRRIRTWIRSPRTPRAYS